MEFMCLGSTNEIGASCHYLRLGNTGLLLDVGQHPNADGPDGLPWFEMVGDRQNRPIHHAIITHAHQDHMGGLPVFLQANNHIGVHMTKPTTQLLDILIPASARLQRRRLLEGSSSHEPMFTLEEAQAISYIYDGHHLDEPFRLYGDEDQDFVSASLFHAGHVLGAAGVLLEGLDGGEQRSVFYTSDTHLSNQAILPGADYPEKALDVLLLEATLGADPEIELTERSEHEAGLCDAIVRTLGRGGTVLIPVFALGRAQEIVALVQRFRQQGKIPEDIPIYTTGSMRALSDVYDKTRFTSPRIDPEFEVFGVPQRRLPRQTARENEAIAEPSIHIAASGMMFERTLSNKLAQRLVGDPRHGIFFVGFNKEDSPGDRLLKSVSEGGDRRVVLSGQSGSQEVKAEVCRFRLSGHSHRRDLIQVVDKLRPAKVALVHGEEDAREWMADNIRFYHPGIEVVLPEQGVPIEL